MDTYLGSCLCGRVSYEINGDLLGFYHCHCRRCRKFSGTGHATNLRVNSQHIKWLCGEELINSYKVPEAERFRNDFCSCCGSPLPRHFAEMKFVVVPAGTLDNDLDCKPQARIFYDSRAAWSCEDDLPVYSEYVPVAE